MKFEQELQLFLDPLKNRNLNFEKFVLPRNCLSTDSSVKMGREEEKNKKKERKKKIRSNPSAHLPVIKTYNSREPSAKPCPSQPLSYLSSSFLPSPLAPRQSASSFSSSPYTSHRMPSCIFHTLYRNYFIALPWISALPPWRIREGANTYLPVNTVVRIRIPECSSRRRGSNFEIYPFFSFFFFFWKS